MSADVTITINGLDELRASFRRAPTLVRYWINRAIQASIFEIEKNATDENFMFKTPRALRTGMLQRSFKFGTVFGDMMGSIGPTVGYAVVVHERNPFMGRIVQKAVPDITKHFGDALDEIVGQLAV